MKQSWESDTHHYADLCSTPNYLHLVIKSLIIETRKTVEKYEPIVNRLMGGVLLAVLGALWLGGVINPLAWPLRFVKIWPIVSLLWTCGRCIRIYRAFRKCSVGFMMRYAVVIRKWFRNPRKYPHTRWWYKWTTPIVWYLGRFFGRFGFAMGFFFQTFFNRLLWPILIFWPTPKPTESK